MKKAILLVLALTVIASASLCATRNGVGVMGLPATGAMLINPSAVPVYKINLGNGGQVGFGGTLSNFDADNSRTDIVAFYTMSNKLGTTGLTWKIGGGIDVISGKVNALSGSGTAIAMILGVEQAINDAISIELIGYPLVVLSSSIDGESYNGNIVGGASIGITYWM